MQENTSPGRRRLGLAALAASAIVALCPAASWAQSGNWPTRPVKLIVPFPAGGSTDAVGRCLLYTSPSPRDS